VASSIDLKPGLQIELVGPTTRVPATVEDIGQPENMPQWRGWSGDSSTVEAMRNLCRLSDVR
jgi:hypothetical protein